MCGPSAPAVPAARARLAAPATNRTTNRFTHASSHRGPAVPSQPAGRGALRGHPSRSKPRPPRAAYTRRGHVRVMFEATGPLTAQEEHALVQRLLLGDEEAVRTIYARFARPVYSLGWRLLGSAEAAE